MLWYKAWLETRLRFFIGLGLLSVMACGIVFSYRAVQSLMPLANSMSNDGTALGRIVGEAAAIESTYRGYVWYQWFRQNLCQTWTLFALLLGTGGLVAHGRSGGALYTLSLPVSRARLVGVRATTGLAELAVLAFVPSVFIPLLSPGIGQSYSIADVAVHGLCLFLAGSAVFSLTVLLSTEFSDIWSPPLLALVAFVLAAGVGLLVPAFEPYSPLPTMTGASYLADGRVPLSGIVVSLVASAVFLFAATRNMRRHDF
jgi:ABC-type transport system involved in multi-copper enzyme maturation permease subunit